jgi:hypothetical protein
MDADQMVSTPRPPRVRASRSRHRTAKAHRVVARATRPPKVVGGCAGSDSRQHRVDRAMAALRSDVLPPGQYVMVAEPGRRGVLGLTNLQRRHIQIFVRSCGQESDQLLRHVVSHELGHVFDAIHMSDSDRSAWKKARGIDPGTPWFGCGYCTDFATPAGDFAEVYSQWARGASTNQSRMASPPGPSALAALAGQFFHG